MNKIKNRLTLSLSLCDLHSFFLSIIKRIILGPAPALILLTFTHENTKISRPFKTQKLFWIFSPPSENHFFFHHNCLSSLSSETKKASLSSPPLQQISKAVFFKVWKRNRQHNANITMLNKQWAYQIYLMWCTSVYVKQFLLFSLLLSPVAT